MRLPNLLDNFDNDVSIYLTGGFAWGRGELPYRDLFDHKGPLNSELFLALDWLLPASPVAIKLAFLCVLIASLAQFAALIARHAPGAAWTATVIYAIAVSSPLVHGHDVNSESWALCLIIAAADLADRARVAPARTAAVLAAGTGAAIVAVGAIKSVYVIAAAPLALTLLAGRPARFGWAALGGAAAGLAILAPFAVNGSLGAMADAVIGYSRDFASANLETISDGGASAVIDYATTYVGVVMPVLGVGLGLVAVAAGGDRRLIAAAALAAFSGWLAARLPGQSYAHYFLLPLPGLSALCGLGIAAFRTRVSGGWAMAAPAIAVVGVALLLGVVPARDALQIDRDSRWGVTALPCVGLQDEAAAAVRRVTAPDDRIQVATGSGASYFGQQIYWQARRLPASRFIFPRDVVPPAYGEVAADLAAAPPAAIVLMPDAVREPVDGAIAAQRMAPVARFDCGDGRAIEVLAPSAT